MALGNNQKFMEKFMDSGIARILWLGALFSISFCGKSSAEEMGLAKAYVERAAEDVVTVNPQKVIEECSAILSRKPKPDLPTLITAYRARALAYMHIRKPAPAKDDIDELLKLKPKNVNFNLMHAEAQVALGNGKNALAELREIIRSHPRFAPARFAIADALGRQDELEEAKTQVNAGIDLDKNNVRGLYIRALIAVRRSEFKQCLEDITKCISMKSFHGYPAPGYPYYIRGKCLLMLRRPRAAIADFVMAKFISPDAAEAAYGVCGCYGEMGKWEMAHQAALEYLRLDPKGRDAKLLYIETCGKTGRWDAGEKSIHEMRKASDKDTYVHSTSGDFYCDAGRYELAIEFYDRAIELSVKRTEAVAEAVCGKATLLACCPDPKLRDGRRAVELAEDVLKRKDLPNWQKWRIQAALAVAHAECGDFEKAIEFAKAAVKDAGPESWSKTDLEAKLKLFQQKKPYRFAEKKGMQPGGEGK